MRSASFSFSKDLKNQEFVCYVCFFILFQFAIKCNANRRQIKQIAEIYSNRLVEDIRADHLLGHVDDLVGQEEERVSESVFGVIISIHSYIKYTRIDYVSTFKRLMSASIILGVFPDEQESVEEAGEDVLGIFGQTRIRLDLLHPRRECAYVAQIGASTVN